MRALLLLSLTAIACSDDRSAVTQADPHALASARMETRAAAGLSVSSPAFAADGAIPLRFSAYGEGRSPPLQWSGLPPGTRSLVLMMEDPDAPSDRPFVHWLAWNIDPAATGLPEGLPSGAEVQHPVALRQGLNDRRSVGYFGPRPPGSRPHHYHFQLFALDIRLELAGGADRDALLAAIRGHVLAKGDLVGLFGRPRR